MCVDAKSCALRHRPAGSVLRTTMPPTGSQTEPQEVFSAFCGDPIAMTKLGDMVNEWERKKMDKTSESDN